MSKKNEGKGGDRGENKGNTECREKRQRESEERGEDKRRTERRDEEEDGGGEEERETKNNCRMNTNIVCLSQCRSYCPYGCFNFHDHPYQKMCKVFLNLSNIKKFIQLGFLTGKEQHKCSTLPCQVGSAIIPSPAVFCLSGNSFAPLMFWC